jgi:hypothetical protein
MPHSVRRLLAVGVAASRSLELMGEILVLRRAQVLTEF